MDIETLNSKLSEYDQKVFQELEIVLEEMAKNSKALASNLKSCFTEISLSDRYLRAYNGEEVAIKEKELREDEFMILESMYAYFVLVRLCVVDSFLIDLKNYL